MVHQAVRIGLGVTDILELLTFSAGKALFLPKQIEDGTATPRTLEPPAHVAKMTGLGTDRDRLAIGGTSEFRLPIQNEVKNLLLPLR